MITPTPKEAKAVLTILEPAQFARLVRVIMELRTEDQWKSPMCAHRQLQMYAYEWLVHLGSLSDDKIRWLMWQMNTELHKFGQYLDREYDNLPCVVRPMLIFTLTITDGRYATWPEQTTWADLQDEAYVSQLDRPGCTHIVGDFLAIFDAKQRWLKRLQGGSGERQHHAEPNDPRRAGGQDEVPEGGEGTPPG
jgi:hypothetical protein